MRTKSIIAILAIVGLLIFVAVSVLGGSKDKVGSTRTKDVPQQINYQGYLVNSSDSSAVTDTLEMIFRIYDDPASGDFLWSEPQSEVPVINGLFNVLLGSVTQFPDDLFNGQELWLETTVEGETLSPRKKLVSVPYGFRSKEADHAMEADSAFHAVHSDTAEYALNAVADNDWVISGSNIYRLNSNVGIGTDSPGTKLDVEGPGDLAVSLGDATSAQTDLYLRSDGSGIGQIRFHDEDLASSQGQIIYDHSTDKMAFVTSGLRRVMIDSSGNVGIGTTNPQATLDVSGNMKLEKDADYCILEAYSYRNTGNPNLSIDSYASRGTKANPSIVFDGDNLLVINGRGYDGTDYHVAGHILLEVDGTPSEGADIPGRIVFATTADGTGSPIERMRIDKNGNVGIGTQNPQGKLDVNGPLAVAGDVGTVGQILKSQGSGASPIWGKVDNVVNADMVDNIHASATPTANYLYPLDVNAKFPNSRLYTGSGNGLDVDMVDGHHASDFLSTSSDYGRSGVATDLYEGTTKLSDKYLGKAATAVNSDKVDGYDAGNASGNVPISNGTLNNNLNADMLDGLHASSFLNTSSDYGRYGVSSTLYEETSSLSDKYVNEGQSNSISNSMIQGNAVTSTKIQDETITGTDIQKPLGLSGSSTAQILHVENNSSSGYGIASIIHHSANTNKSALYGESVASEGGGIGAWGVTHSPGTSSGCALGLYGVSSSPTSIGGAAIGVLGRSYSVPVSGSDASSGVFGWGDVSSGRTYGVWGETRSSTDFVSGVYGVNIASSGMTRGTIGTVNSTTAGAAGVLGAAPSTGAVRGVMGYCHSSSGYAMYSDGNFAVAPGYTKSAIVKTSQGAVKLYCQESPGIWFEDFGEGQLSNGQTHIELDGLFLETVTINERHPMKVFIQLNDDCNGVYVKRGTTGFDVIELQNGKSDAQFTYRVVAKRRGFENTRMEKCDDALIDSDLYHAVKGKVLPR